MKGKYIIVIVTILLIGIMLGNFVSISGINNTVENYMPLIDATQLILVALTFGSLIIVIKQVKFDHEKSRREKTVDLLLTWTKSITKETNAVKKIVETFNTEQCKALYVEEEFSVACSVYNDLIEAINEKAEKPTKCDDCGGNNPECNKLIPLNKKQIKKLRWNTISYLNLLESILVAWQYSIVDREIIEHQFSFMVSPKDGKNVLENFRRCAGSEDTFPAIEIFCSHMENARKNKLKEKGNII